METMNNEVISNKVIDVPDFPEKGIVFKDITPLLLDPKAFAKMIDLFKESIDFEFDKIAAIESRGFLIGAPLAQAMDAGLVLVRKKGKLPRKTLERSYGLEYGQDTIEIQEGDLQPGDRVLIIDDVLATGGTAHACEQLCKEAGATVVGLRFLIGLDFLNGKDKLEAPVKSILSY